MELPCDRRRTQDCSKWSLSHARANSLISGPPIAASSREAPRYAGRPRPHGLIRCGLHSGEIQPGGEFRDRRLNFSMRDDVLDEGAVDRLGALTVPKAGFGYYVPPLGGGESALVNILPIKLPTQGYVATLIGYEVTRHEIRLGDPWTAKTQLIESRK